MTDLFRQQVVDKQLNDMGVPLNISSSWMRFFLLLFLVFCFGIVALITLGSYSRKVSVEGYLVPDKGVTQISSPREGRVRNIHIFEGQKVTSGDLLFTIDVSAESISGDTIAATYSNLVARMTLAEEEIQLSKGIARSEKLTLEQRIEAKRQEVSASEQEARAHALNVEALRAVVERKEHLYNQGLATSDVLDAAIRDIMEARIDRVTQERLLLQLRNELSLLEVELSNFDQKYANDELELKEGLLSVQQQITELEDLKAVLVRAPHSGTVTYVASTVGMAVDQNTTMIRLIPDDSTLEALLLIPSRDAGFVTIGTHVRLRYDAYPYQTFGTHEATVKTISQTTVPQGELPVRPVGNSVEPVYVVTAELASSDIVVSGDKRTLQSGSRFKADLVLEKRKLWQWLLGPIQSLRSSV